MAPKDSLSTAQQDTISTLTEFHRNRLVFDWLQKDVLPALGFSVDKSALPAQPITIASIGCSDGREAYSILLSQWHKRAGLKIKGYDSKKDQILLAQQGLYDTLGYDGPEHRWLQSLNLPAGEAFAEQEYWDADMHKVKIQMSEEAKSAVVFSVHDIHAGPVPDAYDVVMVCNLLYHFNEQERSKILTNLAASAHPHAYLICESDPSWMRYGQYAQWMKDISRFGFEKKTTSVRPDLSQVYVRHSIIV